jgi:methyl-accepting chemotaxis protein
MAFMILCILGLIIIIINSRVKAHGSAMLTQSKQDMTKIVENQLIVLAGDVSNYIISLEAEIDKNMYNAAKLLREVDDLQNGRITQEQLERLKRETGMSDLYLGDTDGVFTLTTEANAVGMSLFSIWDGYRQLVTGQAEYLPSLFKLKVETGEIFKFTAISRLGGRGILESALNTAVIQQYLQRYISKDTGILSMNIFDAEPRTLTHNQAQGAKAYYAQGAAVTSGSPEIGALFKDSSQIKIYMEDNEARIFYPVVSGGTVRYALFLNVDTTGHFAVSRRIESPLNGLVGDMARLNIICFAGVFIALVLCTVFIGVMIGRIIEPLDHFNGVLTSLAQGDFSVAIPEKFLRRKDEAGITAQAFMETIGQVGNMLTLVKQEMGGLRTAGDSLEISVSNNQGQAHLIDNHIADLTEKADKQKTSVEKASESITEVAGHVSNLETLILDQAEGIGKSNVDTSELLESIVSEQQVVIKLRNEMHLLVETTEESKAKQLQLEEHIKNIYGLSEVLNNTNRMISAIAAQTNLLAMNAAIEAAHAGPAGKGFAVVADEIRKLAEDTTAHSKIVGTQVKEIQTGIGLVVAASAVTRESVETMIRYIGEVNAFIQEASSSIDTQNEKSESIRSQLQNITELSGKVQTNASIMRGESQNILKEISQVKAISQDLQNQIHKISQNAGAIGETSRAALTVAQGTLEKIAAISKQLDNFKI